MINRYFPWKNNSISSLPPSLVSGLIILSTKDRKPGHAKVVSKRGNEAYKTTTPDIRIHLVASINYTWNQIFDHPSDIDANNLSIRHCITAPVAKLSALATECCSRCAQALPSTAWVHGSAQIQAGARTTYVIIHHASMHIHMHIHIHIHIRLHKMVIIYYSI